MPEFETPLVELRKLVIAQKTALLPPEAEAPALVNAHAALQAYDLLVSQAVIAAIQGRPVEVPQAEIEAAQSAAQRALDAPDLPTGRERAGYLNYKLRLDRMAKLVRQL